MKKIFLLTAITFLSFQLFAQFPGAAPGKGNQQAANIGHIYGKIVDSLGKQVSEASVVLLETKFDTATKKKKEVLLKGGAANVKGEFDFDQLPMFGALRLKITAVGYKPYEQAVAFQFKMDPNAAKPNAGPGQQAGAMSGMLNNFDKDLGNIRLASDATTLQGVTVTASSSALKLDIDKKVFNVEKNIV